MCRGATYTLYLANAFDPILDFTTHDDVDETPPPVPNVVEVEARSIAVLGSTCGSEPANAARFVLDDLDDATIVLVGRDPEETAGDTVFEGMQVVGLSQDTPVAVGSGPCLSGWPEAAPGASATFVVGTLDVAGNFSGWSDPIDVTLPLVSTVTCSHTSTSEGTPLGALALVSLLVVARHRRAHPSVSRPLR